MSMQTGGGDGRMIDALARAAGTPLTRRAAAQVFVLTAAGAALGANPFKKAPPGTGTPAAPAPVPGTDPDPAKKVPSFLDNVIAQRTGKIKDRSLRVHIHLQSYTEDFNRRSPNDNRALDIHYLEFKTATVVFPVIYGTSTSTTMTDYVKGVVQFDDRVVDSEPEYSDNYPCGTRLARWTLQDKKGRELDLEVEIPVRCASITYDERAAAKAVWPAKWGKTAQSSFAPQAWVNPDDEAVAALLSQWTKGKDPKSIPPLELAKFLMAKCVEYFQPSGSGETFLSHGGMEGLDLNGSEFAIREKNTHEHDIACAVCAIFRAAGLPTRTVSAWDVSGKRGEDGPFDRGDARRSGELRSYVEFCLYDEAADRELWLPCDVVRQRDKGSRVQLDRSLDFFGNYDEGELIIPFAFQFHPPTSVVAHGSPAYWGWLSTPRIPIASQFIRFNSIDTPKRPPSPGVPANRPLRGN